MNPLSYMNTKSILSTHELCRILDISIDSFRKRLSANESLKAIAHRTGRNYIWMRDDLEAVVALLK